MIEFEKIKGLTLTVALNSTGAIDRMSPEQRQKYDNMPLEEVVRRIAAFDAMRGNIPINDLRRDAKNLFRELGLSTRVINVLLKNNILTLDGLKAVINIDEYYGGNMFYRIGVKTVQHIRKALEDHDC